MSNVSLPRCTRLLRQSCQVYCGALCHLALRCATRPRAAQKGLRRSGYDGAIAGWVTTAKLDPLLAFRNSVEARWPRRSSDWLDDVVAEAMRLALEATPGLEGEALAIAASTQVDSAVRRNLNEARSEHRLSSGSGAVVDSSPDALAPRRRRRSSMRRAVIITVPNWQKYYAQRTELSASRADGHPRRRAERSARRTR